jgi:hypothetical protein
MLMKTGSHESRLEQGLHIRPQTTEGLFSLVPAHLFSLLGLCLHLALLAKLSVGAGGKFARWACAEVAADDTLPNTFIVVVIEMPVSALAGHVPRLCVCTAGRDGIGVAPADGYTM